MWVPEILPRKKKNCLSISVQPEKQKQLQVFQIEGIKQDISHKGLEMCGRADGAS